MGKLVHQETVLIESIFQFPVIFISRNISSAINVSRRPSSQFPVLFASDDEDFNPFLSPSSVASIKLSSTALSPHSELQKLSTKARIDDCNTGYQNTTALTTFHKKPLEDDAGNLPNL